MLRIRAPGGQLQPGHLTSGSGCRPGCRPGCGGSCSEDILRAALPPDPQATGPGGSTAGAPTGPAVQCSPQFAAAASHLVTNGWQDVTSATLKRSQNGRHMRPRCADLMRKTANSGTAAAARLVIWLQPAKARHLRDVINARCSADHEPGSNTSSYGLRSKLHCTCASSSCPARSARSAPNSRCRKRPALLSSVPPVASLPIATVIVSSLQQRNYAASVFSDVESADERITNGGWKLAVLEERLSNVVK